MDDAVHYSLLVREGKSGKEGKVEGSTKGPCSQWFSFVLRHENEFRRGIESGSRKVRVCIRMDPGSCSKVDEFAGLSADVYQHVLRFDVSVDDPCVVV